jgi:arylformamidase
MSRIFDISRPMSPRLAGWPGDTPFSLGWTMRQSDGQSVNVGRLTLSVHTGAHTDAPYHYDSDAATIDQVPLDVYLGPVRLIDVRGQKKIGTDAFAAWDLSVTPRVLLRTDGWVDAKHFPESIPVMDQAVPTYLQQQGVVLVGLDVPSVDHLNSKSLPIHNALGKAGIHILEGLDLREPPEGIYELIALPLNILGGDGAPVRAILREPSTPPSPTAK